jgi:hypothetical protein
MKEYKWRCINFEIVQLEAYGNTREEALELWCALVRIWFRNHRDLIPVCELGCFKSDVLAKVSY